MASSGPNFPKLGGTNYPCWSGDMEAWLKACGLWRIVKGLSARPTFASIAPSTLETESSTPGSTAKAKKVAAAAAELKDAWEAKAMEMQDAWDQKSDKAAGWIWLSLEEDVRTLVRGCKDDPQVMWTTLEDTYHQKKAGNRFNAYDTLFSICKQDDESLQTLINRVDDTLTLCQALRPLDFDITALDKELSSMVLLRALPEDYRISSPPSSSLTSSTRPQSPRPSSLRRLNVNAVLQMPSLLLPSLSCLLRLQLVHSAPVLAIPRLTAVRLPVPRRTHVSTWRLDPPRSVDSSPRRPRRRLRSRPPHLV